MITSKLRLPTSIWRIIDGLGNRDIIISSILDVLIQNDLLDNLPPTEFAYLVDDPIVSHKVHVMSDDYEMTLDSPHSNNYSIARAVMFAIDNDMLEDIKLQATYYDYTKLDVNYIKGQLLDILNSTNHIIQYMGTHKRLQGMEHVQHIIDDTTKLFAELEVYVHE